MASAIFSLPNLFESLHALLGWLAPPQPAPAPAAVSVSRAQRAGRPVVRARRPVAPRAAASLPARPLRVLRVVEPSAPRTVAGRMVISGRMADVCAELDRLAAQEARGH